MTYCPNCGSPVEGRFCAKCGTAANPGATAGASSVPPSGAPPYGSVPPSTPPYSAVPPTAAPAAAGMTDNVAGALCYLLGFITGILFLVLEPYNRNRLVRFHAFQSIFLNLAWIVIWIAATIVAIALHVIPVLGVMIGLLLHLALGLGALIVWLYMMFKTYNNQTVVLPVIGPMAEKQAASGQTI